MKKVISNVVSAIVIIAIMAVCNRLTVTEVKYGEPRRQEVSFAQGFTDCTIRETTRLLFTGEIIKDEVLDVCIIESAKDWYSGKNRRDHIRLGFR